MPSRRLQRLAALTQGLALVGLGVSASACSNDPPRVNSMPPSPPVMNAPVQQPGGDASALGPGVDASMKTPPPPVAGDAEPFVPHTVNAPPKGWNPPPVSSAKP